jgi:hypothetical protein
LERRRRALDRRGKPARHPLIALVVGILIALAIVAGIFVLFAYQE